MSEGLQRLVITFGRDPEIRVLYKRTDGLNPGTVRWRRGEAEQLAREGLRTALEALEGPVEIVGEAGFKTREDTLAASRRKAAGGVGGGGLLGGHMHGN